MRIASVLAAFLLAEGCSSVPDPKILDVAQNYASYGRVDGNPRSVLTDCRAPMPDPPRLSQSRDAETHGRKLYYLFAKDRLAYLHARDLDQPIGQAVVKESWIPGNPATKGPLFMMIKSDGAPSDAGWIYATATPDGKTITASGRLASCMDCHQGARRDRLFGLKSCAAPD
jgi:hypothetical protein